MAKKHFSIQEAADLSNKSIQTIRRAIKSKKLKARKQKTPQGFNYLVNAESLCKVFKVKLAPDVKEVKSEVKATPKKKAVAKKKDVYVNVDDFRNLTKTLEKMVSQHSEERQNFVRLINTLQEKIFVMENQLNLLKSPAKKWYQVWK